MFDITGKTLKPVSEARSSDEMERWWNILAEEGRAKKAIESLQKSMTSTEIEALARQVFEEVSSSAVDAGVSLPKEYILRLIGELSGMGPLAIPDTTRAKIFSGCYAIYSGLMLVMSAGVVFAPLVHRFLHKLHADEDDVQERKA